MAGKVTYYAAFVDRAYGDAYRIHSSVDLKKLVKLMIAEHRKLKLGRDVIVLSRARIAESSEIWNTVAGTTRLIGHIEMDSTYPVFYSKSGKKARVLADGSFKY